MKHLTQSSSEDQIDFGDQRNKSLVISTFNQHLLLFSQHEFNVGQIKHYNYTNTYAIGYLRALLTIRWSVAGLNSSKLRMGQSCSHSLASTTLRRVFVRGSELLDPISRLNLNSLRPNLLWKVSLKEFFELLVHVI